MKMTFCLVALALVVGQGLAAAGGTPSIPFGSAVCSKYKEQDAVRGTRTVSVYGLECLLKSPAKQSCQQNVIAPLAKAATEPAELFTGYLCYKVKCPKALSTITAQDAFGPHSGTFKQPGLVCVPAGPSGQ